MADLRKLFEDVTKACKEAGVEYVFALPEGTSYSVTKDSNLKELVEVIKTQD